MTFNLKATFALAAIIILSASYSFSQAPEEHTYGGKQPKNLGEYTRQFRFLENNGQLQDFFDVQIPTISDVRYYTNAFGGTAYFGENGIAFGFMKETENKNLLETVGFNFQFNNSNEVCPEGHELNRPYLNLIGQSNKVPEIHSYSRVKYVDLYDGIDLYYSLDHGQLKFDYYVAPGAKPQEIELSFSDVRGLEIDKKGNLSIYTAWGTLTDEKPYSYQIIDGKETPIDVNYKLNGNLLTFDIPDSYDPNYELVIDPLTMNWATYLTQAGAGDNGYMIDMAVDDDGAVYCTGYGNVDMPSTNELGTATRDQYDVYVIKVAPDGATLEYATFIKGSTNTINDNEIEAGFGIEVNAAGEAFIGGTTSSADFPVTDGTTHQGLRDIFLLKLNAAGSAIDWCTMYGGTGNESCYDIAMNGNDIYLTGYTYSSGLATAGVYDNTYNAGQDSYILKYDDNGTLQYFTYYGGPGDDWCKGIAVNTASEPYLHGTTDSDSDIASAGALDTGPHTGNYSTFVARFSADGTTRTYGTYYHGCCQDYSGSILVNSNNEAIIAGTTELGIPVANAYQAATNGSLEIYMAGINTTGTGLIFSSYYGGSAADGEKGNTVASAHPQQYWRPVGLDITDSTLVISFTTGSDDLVFQDPLNYATANPNDADGNYDGTVRDNWDACVAMFDYSPVYTAGNMTLEFSSLFGGTAASGSGSGNDYPTGGVNFIDKDCGYCVALGMSSHSNDLPTTTGAYQTNSLVTSGNDQNAVALMCDINPVSFTVTPTNPTCPNNDGQLLIAGLDASTTYSVHYTDNGVVIGPSNMTTNVSGEITITTLDTGTYTNVAVLKSATCGDTLAGPFNLTVTSTIDIDDLSDTTVCDSLLLPEITGTDLTGGEAYFTGPGGTGTQINAATCTEYMNINTPGYTEDADLTGSLPLTNLASGLFSFTGTPNGAAAFAGTGIQISDDATIGRYIRVQHTGVDDPTSSDYVEYEFNFGSAVIGFSWVTSAFNFGERVEITAFNGATQITIDESHFIDVASGLDVVGNMITAYDYNGSSAVTNRGFQTVIPEAVDRIVIRAGLYADPGGNSNFQLQEFSSCDATPVYITTSGTYYIYDVNGACFDEESFDVTINQSPIINDFADVNICDSYTLTSISGSNLSGTQGYYTRSSQGGTAFTANDVLTNGAILFMYDETGTSPNCFDEEVVFINLELTPDLDPLGDTTVCDSLLLPTITGSFLSSNQAYYTDPNGAGTRMANCNDFASLNTPGYALDTDLSGSLPLTGLAGGVMDFNGTLNGAATWSGGVQIQNDATVGEFLFLQPNNAHDPTTAADFVTYEMSFGTPVSGLSWIIGGLNFDDMIEIEAYNGATPITIGLDNYSDISPGMEPSGNTVIGINRTGNTQVFQNFLRITIPEEVDRIVVNSGKNTNTNTNVTIAMHSFSSCEGDIYLNTSGTYYIYDSTTTSPSCADQQSFNLTVETTPNISALANQSACDSLQLPTINGTLSGNEAYFTGPGGTGTRYDANDYVLSSISPMYIYDETGSNPNCTDETSFDIDIYVKSPISVAIQEPTCTGNDGELYIYALDNAFTYDVSYNDGSAQSVSTSATNDTVTITGFGAINVTGIQVDSAGCLSNIETASFTNPTAPTITVAIQEPTCAGNDGELYIFGLTNGFNYNIDYNDGSAQSTSGTPSNDTLTITGFAGGIITGIQVDSLGCLSNIETTTFTDPTPPVITVGIQEPTCAGNDGELYILGLTNGFNYNIDYNDGSAQSTTGTPSNDTLTITGFAGGNITGIQIDSLGCPSNIETTTFTDPTPPVITVGIQEPTCAGNDGELYILGLNNGFNYDIDYNDGSAQSTTGTPSNDTLTITGFTGGNVTGIQVDSLGCLSNIETTTFTDPTPPVITVGIQEPTCAGNDGELYILGLTNGFNYNIDYNDGSAQSTTGTPVNDTLTVTGLGAGNVTGIQVDSLGCLSNIETTTFTDPTPPVITVGQTDPSACGATDGSFFILGLDNGFTYQVNYNDGTAQSTNLSTVNDTITVSGFGAGGVTGISVDSLGCISNLESVSFTDPSAPTIAVTGIVPDCDLDNGQLIITGLTNGFTYDISYLEDATLRSVSLAPVNDSIILSSLPGAIYSNISVDSNSCVDSEAGPFDLTNPVSPTITVATNQTSCSNDDGTLYILGLANGFPYDLSYDDGTIQNTTGTPVNDTLTVTGLDAGSITSIMVDSLGCLSNTEVAVIDSPAAPVITVSTQEPTCFGNDGEIHILGLTNGFTYDLTYDDGTIQSTTGTPVNDTLVLSGFSAGTVTDIIIDSLGCLSNVETGTFSVLPTPTISVGQLAPTSCGASDGEFYILGLSNGFNYDITYNDGAVQSTTLAPVNDTITITGFPAGGITDIQVDSLGCPSNLESVSLSDPNAPNIIVSLLQPSCAGNDGSLLITGVHDGFSYDISYTQSGTPQNGSFSATNDTIRFDGLGNEIFTNIVVDSNNCVDSEAGPFELFDVGVPVISVAGTDPSCVGDDGSITISGLTDGFAYDLSYVDSVLLTQTITSTAGNFELTGLSAGTYSDINIDSLGCISDSEDVTLGTPTPATINVAPINPTSCGGSDGSFTITGLVANTAYTIDYLDDGTGVTATVNSSALGAITISGLDAGNYSGIQATEGVCVSNQVTVTLSDPGTPTITVSGVDPTCDSDTGTITISGLTPAQSYDVSYQSLTTGTVTITESADGSGEHTITGLEADTYFAINVTSNGCTSNSETFTLTAPTCETLVVTSTDPSQCGGNDGTLILSGLVAGEVYDVFYTDDGVDQSVLAQTADSNGEIIITGLDEGAYTNIFVTRGTFTSSSFNEVLTEPVAPTITGVVTGTSTCGGSNGTITISGLDSSTTYTINYFLNGAAQGALTLTSNSNGEISLAGLTAGEFTFITATANACESNAIDHTVSDPTPGTFPVTAVNETCDGNDGSLEISDLTAFETYDITYTDPAGSTHGPATALADNHGQIIIDTLSAGVYTNILVEEPNSCSSTFAGPFTIGEPEEQCEPWIPTAISPNDDGDNDTWKIKGLDFYENPIVRVYNRYGNLVWELEGTYVPWDGYRNGEPMPVATYYYVVLPEGELGKKYTGPLTIMR